MTAVTITFLFGLLLLLTVTTCVYGHEEAFFSSSAVMEIDWISDDVDNLNLREINEFESAIAVLLTKTMKDNDDGDADEDDHDQEGDQDGVEYPDNNTIDLLLPEQQVIAVDMHVKNVTKKDASFHMNAIVDVLYLSPGEGVNDMATVLMSVTTQQDMEELLLDEIYNSLGGTADSVAIHFKTLGDGSSSSSSAAATKKLWQLQHEEDHSSSSSYSPSNDKNSADTALILACTLLCAALVLVTSILLYVVGGWRDLREKMEEQMDWFKTIRRTYSGDEDEDESDEESGGVDVADSQSVDDDDDDDDETDATNPSGIIGASSKDENMDGNNNNNNAVEGLGIHRTPERGINDDDEEDGYNTTPFSEMSSYTDTSRAPLGITSMRKMTGNNIRHDMALPPLAYQ